MKNIEIVTLNDVLAQNASQLKDLKGAKFAYAVNKNLERLKKESKYILDSRQVTPEYQAYETSRIAICERYAGKDESGRVNTRTTASGQTEYAIDVNNPDFKSEIEALRIANATVLEVQEKYFQDFNGMLSGENEQFELFRVALDDVPEEITTELMSVIMQMVRE